LKIQSKIIGKKAENNSSSTQKPNQKRMVTRPRTPHPQLENPIKSDW